MYYMIAGQFAMSHGSYDLNLGSEILILGRDIRSRSWPNIDGTYGIHTKAISVMEFCEYISRRALFC